MVAFPLLLLSLAAGIYLLMKATREYLGGLYKVLAWLVILLSLLGLGAQIVRGVHHFRHRHDCKMMHDERCMMHDGCAPGACAGPGGGANGACMMGGGCKMVGDSVIMDKVTCEKLIGKDSCDKICSQRGQCIFSKNECIKLCGGADKCCMANGQAAMPSCCMKDGKPGNACCGPSGPEAGMKECCKKK
jgi:hypothetical protein